MSKSNTSLNEVIRLHIKKVEQVENEKGELTLFSNITNQEYHQKLKSKIDESELIRIIKHLNPDNNNTDGSTFAFVQDLLILKVGGSIKKYSDFANMKVGNDNNIGKLILNITDDNEKDKILETKTFKRKICASGHNRSQKVMFVSEYIYDKLDKILLCGLDSSSMVIPSKFNSYDGLVATDSKPVSMPTIVVVDDYETSVQGKYDIVTMTTEHEKVKGKTTTKHTYHVDNDEKKSVKILPFDGAGLVSVSCAQKWAKELDKDYIPASFQFRCLAGLKGNLFTFDVDKFGSIYGTAITDIWGKTWDLVDDKVNVIMTKSQFKFWGLYQNETKNYGGWLEAFNMDEYGYKRTFNISEVAEECKHLKNYALMSYQPLQTLNLSDHEVGKLCCSTVEKIKTIHNSVEAFLKYRNIREFDNGDSCGDEQGTCQEWNFMQPYYQAMLYNHSLFNDEYIRGKIKRDIKTIIRKACMGKISVSGNYQTLAPDLYGLAQYAFGQEVAGLIGEDEIYSNYWNNRYDKVTDEKGSEWYVGVDEVDLLRSPHVANEHCPVKIVSNSDMEKWFKYQTVNILTGFKDTNVLKSSGADFDGDHVLTVNNPIILTAAKKNIANTIDFVKVDLRASNGGESKKECKILDIKTLIETDKIGFQNSIGKVINKISLLWSLEQTQSVQDFIKTMSVVGSQTIDFVKTGIKIDIPKEIMDYISTGQYKLPYFMQYGSNAKLSKENMTKSEIERLTNIGFETENQNKYNDTDCTMNKICHYMENHLLDLHIEDTKAVFKYASLLTSEINPYNETYKVIKGTLLHLQKDFNDICKKYNKLEETEQKDYGQRQYQRFYSYCKVELQAAYYSKMRNVDNHKIVDYLVYMFYADASVMVKCFDKSILWNTFAREMLQRVKGEIKTTICDVDKLQERRAKSIKAVAKIKESSRIIGVTEFDKAPPAKFTKSDKSQLKKLVKDKEARKLLFVLVVLHRKLEDGKEICLEISGKNKINRSRICKLADIDVRHYDKTVKHLKDLDLLDVDTKNVLKQKYGVNFNVYGGDVCAEIVSLNDCSKAVSNDFNYLQKRS